MQNQVKRKRKTRGRKRKNRRKKSNRRWQKKKPAEIKEIRNNNE